MNKNSDKAHQSFSVYQKQKERIVTKDETIKGISIRKTIRPLLVFMLRIQRLFTGLKIEIISKPDFKRDKPVIYAVSHIGKWDLEIIHEVLRNHFWVVAADFLHMYGHIDLPFMWATGCIFVNEYSKSDRRYTKKMMTKVLKQGDNVLIFPEGEWNLTENEIIRDTSFGTVDSALRTGVSIVPIAMEQYQNLFVINVGEDLCLDEISGKYTDKEFSELDMELDEERRIIREIELEANRILRDALATLKWEIWERKGIERRKDIPSNYWYEFIKLRGSEWRGFDLKDQIVNGCFPPEKKEWIRVQQTMAKLNPKWWSCCWLDRDI
ncbi:MAG: 1-acyl-sn-glycerol-3-phosphate acyltransferase [Agathobacter sp.]|nr:1-acyl-sn-glycerol-3-phosphate acyltransferase [Agathobacter sp.]